VLAFSVIYYPVATYLKKWLYIQKLARYARQTENIYEASLYKRDKEVHKRAQEHRKLLIASGNKLSVKVLEFYFRDAEHLQETWEEFEERVEKAMEEDRASRHKVLNGKSRNWYLHYVLRQDQVDL
jgi:aromatic ring-opening dioxygenase catalytic subunit (LigB family)